MKTRWFAYALLGVGIFLFLRSRSAASAPDNSSAGIPTDGLSVGQIGSNFFESNSLADALKGLVDGIWENGGTGYGGYLQVKTPEGTLNYKPPNLAEPSVFNPRTNKLVSKP